LVADVSGQNGFTFKGIDVQRDWPLLLSEFNQNKNLYKYLVKIRSPVIEFPHAGAQEW
jgi:hypothetical protein